jgi:thiamine pyrophosphate-dependent acetolactate synthase large subunit-like protein
MLAARDRWYCRCGEGRCQCSRKECCQRARSWRDDTAARPDLQARPALQRYNHTTCLGSEYLADEIERDVIVTTDVGQHQMWASQYLDIAELVTSSARVDWHDGFGFRGLGCPDRQSWKSGRLHKR